MTEGTQPFREGTLEVEELKPMRKRRKCGVLVKTCNVRPANDRMGMTPTITEYATKDPE